MLWLKETGGGRCPTRSDAPDIIGGLPPGVRLLPALGVGAGRTTLGACFQKVQIWVCEEKAYVIFVVLCERQYLNIFSHSSLG